LKEEQYFVCTPDIICEPLGKRVVIIGCGFLMLCFAIDILWWYGFYTVEDIMTACYIAGFNLITIAFWVSQLILRHKRSLINLSTKYIFDGNTLTISCGKYSHVVHLTSNTTFEVISFHGGYDILFGATKRQKKAYLQAFHYFEGTMCLLRGNKRFSFWYYPYPPAIWGISDCSHVLKFLEKAIA